MIFNPETIKWNGCLASAGMSVSAVEADTFPPQRPFGWYQWALPATNQIGPSCVGQSWANWLECMLRRYVGNFGWGEQIDGELIWRRAREMFWNGDLSGGLYLPQGFYAMLDLGLVPPETTIRPCGTSWKEVSAQLASTPLVQAHHIHPGWFHAHSVSGMISHTPSPGPADGYHATLLMATGVRGEELFRVGQNSWGPDYARFGFFGMTDAEWFEGICPDGLYTAWLPPTWKTWTGWKAAVKKIERD